MKSTTAKSRAFYDGYVDKLKTVNNRHMWVFNSFSRFIPKGRVLDIGCGAGITSKQLAEGGRDVVAVDLSPELIRYAKACNNHPCVEYITSDISEIKDIGLFDAVVMVDVLEHIVPESVDTLFSVIKNCSHENTVIYLNIPSGDVLTWLWENKPDTRQIIDTPYSHAEIVGMFKRIGFDPMYYHLYWGQYVEYLFMTKQASDMAFRKAFK